MVQLVLKRFTILVSVIQVLNFQLSKPLGIFVPWPRKLDPPNRPTVVCALFRICVTFKSHASSKHVAWACINMLASTIIEDSLSWISDVAFCTARPNGGLSCLSSLRHEQYTTLSYEITVSRFETSHIDIYGPKPMMGGWKKEIWWI